MLLVFGLYDVLECQLNLACGCLFAVAGGIAVAEEEAQGEHSPSGFGILDVAHSRDGRYVEPRAFGNILQYHWPELAFVASGEEVLLPVDYCLHGCAQRSASLPHRFDVALSLVYLLFKVEQSLLVLPGHALLVVAIGFHHGRERRRHIEFGHTRLVQREADVAVVVGVDDEVGRYLLNVSPFGFAHRCSGLGVEAAYQLLHAVDLGIAQVHREAQFVPVFLCELVEVAVYYLPHQAYVVGL